MTLTDKKQIIRAILDRIGNGDYSWPYDLDADHRRAVAAYLRGDFEL